MKVKFETIAFNLKGLQERLKTDSAAAGTAGSRRCITGCITRDGLRSLCPKAEMSGALQVCRKGA